MDDHDDNEEDEEEERNMVGWLVRVVQVDTNSLPRCPMGVLWEKKCGAKVKCEVRSLYCTIYIDCFVCGWVGSFVPSNTAEFLPLVYLLPPHASRTILHAFPAPSWNWFV